MRECKICHKTFKLESFPKNGNDGYRWQCSGCMSKINREWRIKNKVHLRNHMRDYRDERRARTGIDG